MIARLIMGITAAFAVIVGEAATTVANAEDQPITRTELLTADLAGIAGKEAYIYIADVKPAAAGPRHTHYGDEFVYILEGALVVTPDGKEPITLKQGEIAHLPTDVVHAAKNGSESEPAKVLIFLVVEKDKPRAEVAK